MCVRVGNYRDGLATMLLGHELSFRTIEAIANDNIFDTNVVLRYVLNDDKAQARKAAALIRRHKEVLITDVVLAETV